MMKAMNEYKAGDGKLSVPFTAFGEGWLVADFAGAPSYSNGHLILQGPPPSKEIAEQRPNMAKVEKAVSNRTALMRPKGFVEPEQTGWPRKVYFDAIEMPVDAKYYDHILSRFPDAVFRAPRQNDWEKPITICSKRKIVGAIMCIRV